MEIRLRGGASDIQLKNCDRFVDMSSCDLRPQRRNLLRSGQVGEGVGDTEVSFKKLYRREPGYLGN